MKNTPKEYVFTYIRQLLWSQLREGLTSPTATLFWNADESRTVDHVISRLKQELS